MQYYEILFVIGALFLVTSLASSLCALICHKEGVTTQQLAGDSLPSPELFTDRGRLALRVCKACRLIAALFLLAAFAVGIAQAYGLLPYR